MNCDEVNRLLDLLMDGELTDEQRLELERHGRECPECAASIRETMQLKALMADMEPEVDVPLAAQAAWRNAVREEARQGRTRRFRRWAASAAAALVVLVGVGLAMNLRGAPKQDATAVPEVAAKLAYEAEEADEAAVEAVEAEANSAAYVPEVAYEAEAFDAAESAVVETDGATSGVRVLAGGGAPATSDAEARRTPACELSLRVADVDTGLTLLTERGYITPVAVTAALKAEAGRVGELAGEFSTRESDAVGTVDVNGDYGVAGPYHGPEDLWGPAVPVAAASQAHTGDATLFCAADGVWRGYDCRIIRLKVQSGLMSVSSRSLAARSRLPSAMTDSLSRSAALSFIRRKSS